MSTWPEVVRERLLAEWGAQACMRPADWPGVLDKLMKPGGGHSGPRTEFKSRVEAAVLTLAEAFQGDPADPADVVWRAFPMLNRPRCHDLGQQLIRARKAFL